ncbi:MerC domain-containing protein [Pseudoalteromonas luteoviolacea]|uniref:MerC domain-containing protein n=1 Tax=Pseudoalteromonas luteoviolacea TaxID=43657 RepID=UPI001F1FBBFB|nr:MerC domain-containing protein [Pseudoalteromonas luteoviolacea]MCF6439775.1 MerC domain-containing protein [Pseudoalteromonas luteoviolacea]
MLGSFQQTGDRVSIGLAFLCVAHCLVLPVVVLALPFVATSFLQEEAFHQMLLFGVLITSIVALYSGCKSHQKWKIFYSGIFGLVVLSVAAFFGHDLLGDAGETILTVVGSLVVAYSHLINIKTCRSDECRS